MFFDSEKAENGRSQGVNGEHAQSVSHLGFSQLINSVDLVVDGPFHISANRGIHW
jgi:hypothetical protein